MPPAKQTYPIELSPLRSAHYEAIGRVIAFWAFVEREIKAEIGWLDRRLNNRKTINFNRSFGALTAEWQSLAQRAALPRKALNALNRIAGQSAKIQCCRDALAHGAFLGSPEAPIYLRTKNGKVVGLDDTAANLSEMRSLACKIGDIAAELLQLQAFLAREFDDRP